MDFELSSEPNFLDKVSYSLHIDTITRVESASQTAAAAGRGARGEHYDGGDDVEATMPMSAGDIIDLAWS